MNSEHHKKSLLGRLLLIGGTIILVVFFGAATYVYGYHAGTLHPETITVKGVTNIDDPQATGDFSLFWQAWQELKLPRAELLVIGSPIDDFGRRLMDRYAGTCRWLPNVPNDEIHSHFQRSHVFVLPSLAEGSALVSYEAMASGLPVITTANAGAIARDGIEGFILPLRDVKGIQEKLVLLYQDAELRQRMGAAARRRAEQFTWGHYRARLGAAYRALAAGQPPQQAVATVGATVECVP